MVESQETQTKKDLSDIKIDRSTFSEFGRLIVSETDFVEIPMHSYYRKIKVKNGSFYVIYTSYRKFKAKTKKGNKGYYGAFLFRMLPDGKWKVAKWAKRSILWKLEDVGRKWAAEKLKQPFTPRKSAGNRISEKRRAELANRMLDFAGRKHGLPVFEKSFTCPACSHQWDLVTYDNGTIVCPACDIEFCF